MTALALVHAIRWHWRREFSENVGMALDTLRAHKVRSGLTVFGIIVAVVIVIVVVALLAMGLRPVPLSGPPGMKVVEIDSAGHVETLSRKEFVAAIRAFLAAQR